MVLSAIWRTRRTSSPQRSGQERHDPDGWRGRGPFDRSHLDERSDRSGIRDAMDSRSDRPAARPARPRPRWRRSSAVSSAWSALARPEPVETGRRPLPVRSPRTRAPRSPPGPPGLEARRRARIVTKWPCWSRIRDTDAGLTGKIKQRRQVDCGPQLSSVPRRRPRDRDRVEQLRCCWAAGGAGRRPRRNPRSTGQQGDGRRRPR